MCMRACISICRVHAGAHDGQKKVSHPLALGLQVVMSHYVGAGNRARSSEECSEPLGHLLSPSVRLNILAAHFAHTLYTLLSFSFSFFFNKRPECIIEP